MEGIADDAKLEVLRRANSCFGRFFARFSGAALFGTDEEIEALRQVEFSLESVRVLLEDRIQRSQHAAMRQELADYGANLVRLRAQLGLMQQSAMDCQTRLRSRQQHLHAAKSWCALARDAN